MNACLSVPLLLLVLPLGAYFFSSGETSNGWLVGGAFLLVQVVSFTVLARRGTFRGSKRR